MFIDTNKSMGKGSRAYYRSLIRIKIPVSGTKIYVYYESDIHVSHCFLPI